MAVIVIIVTVKGADNPKLTDYLSFALTLSSLILAIVAIAITIAANSDLSRNFASLASATADMRLSATEVKSSSHQMSALSDRLATNLESVSSIVGSVRDRVESTHDTLAEFVKSQAQAQAGAQIIGEQVTTAQAHAVVQPSVSELVTFEKKRFLTTLSTISIVALYVAARLSGTGKTIDRAEFVKSVRSASSEYYQACWVIFFSADIVSMTTTEPNHHEFHACNIGTADKLKAELLRRAEGNEKAGGLPSKAFILELISKTDAFIDVILSTSVSGPVQATTGTPSA